MPVDVNVKPPTVKYDNLQELKIRNIGLKAYSLPTMDTLDPEKPFI